MQHSLNCLPEACCRSRLTWGCRIDPRNKGITSLRPFPAVDKPDEILCCLVFDFFTYHAFPNVFVTSGHIAAFTFKRSGRDSNPATASSARCHRDLSSPVQSCHNSTGCSGGDPVFRSADHLLRLHVSSGFHHQPADRMPSLRLPPLSRGCLVSPSA